MAEKEAPLRVAEAIQDDVNKGIVRIDSSFMRDIDVNPGDVIEIGGERKTVGIVDRSYPGDIGLDIIRMDGLMRRNAKTGLGETVKVKKAEVKEATKVTIAPARKGIVVKAAPNTFKRGLLGRAIVKGDIISLGGATRRRTTMAENPFFSDIFPQMDEQFSSFFADLKFIVVSTDTKEAAIITEKTQVILNPEAVEVKEEEFPEVTYEDIGGLDEELEKVREMVELPLKHPEVFERLGIEPPKGVLMHGPPGTGKTLLAKAVANETNAHFILINGPEIMSKFYGESEANLRKKFEEAEKNAPSIIFIDEIDAIATKREEAHGEVEKRVVAQLLALMDGLQNRGKVVVIAASNIPHALDPALRRPGRFDRELEISVPGKDARHEIMKIHTRNMPLGKDVKLKNVAQTTHGFVGADLSALAKESAMIVLRRVFPDLQSKDEAEPIPQNVLEKLVVHQKDFIDALRVVRPSAMREVFVEVPNTKWDKVGGLEEVRQELEEAVEWPLNNAEAFTRLGIRPPKGVLLYGPPGTGKTLLAKAIATETQANFIAIKGPELLSKWVGESEKAVREIFKKARQTAPTIIFFDEIDSIAPRRDTEQDSKATERVVNQLLTEMDGLEELHGVVVIAATNRPDRIDSALLRAGRFDRLVLTPVPDLETRFEIFKIHSKGMEIVEEEKKENTPVTKDKTESKEIKKPDEKKKNKTKKEDILHELAQNSEGYVGSDIEAVCREAAIFALRKNMKAEHVTKKDFEDAMKKVRKSVDEETEESYKNFQDQFKLEKSKEMKEHMNYLG